MLKDIKGNTIKNNDNLVSGLDNVKYKVVEKNDKLYISKPLISNELFELNQRKIDFNDMAIQESEMV